MKGNNDTTAVTTPNKNEQINEAHLDKKSCSANPTGADVYSQDMVQTQGYDKAVKKLRQFFEKKGFVEVHTQSRLSILAACEDPTTVQTYNYMGQLWPLPQTGQMWLEYELLTKPDVSGYFCISTSYRHEPNPIPGRHRLIFPMFEFETHGDINDLQKLEIELLESLNIAQSKKIPILRYEDVAKKYGVSELSSKEEQKMWEDYGSAQLLTHFPQHTSPFWNMKINPENKALANKIDVIICGQETIGSAERSSNPEEMNYMFHHISEGKYAELLYSLFGKERVEKELEAFLALKFFPRVGGGIGLTRLMRAFDCLHQEESSWV